MKYNNATLEVQYMKIGLPERTIIKIKLQTILRPELDVYNKNIYNQNQTRIS